MVSAFLFFHRLIEFGESPGDIPASRRDADVGTGELEDRSDEADDGDSELAALIVGIHIEG